MATSTAERLLYEARQARLLEGLMRGEGVPGGFSAPKAAAASSALRRKRARAVARTWPALVQALDGGFDERFDAYARATSAAVGGGLADGLAFARGLNRDDLSEHARVEILLARRAVGRGGFFVGAVLCRSSRRLLIALRIPGAGRGEIAVPYGRLG